jgi:hypothetical protein
MTRPTDSPMFDQRIADWLEDDPTQAPPLLLETVRAAVPSIGQRRAPTSWARLRFLPAARYGAIAAILVVTALLAVALSLALLGGPTPGPTTAPSRGPVLSGAMAPFTSPWYGYSIDHPAEWTVREATESLVEGGAPWIDSPGVDYTAAAPIDSIAPGVILGAAPLSPGRTLDAWTNLTAVATCGTPDSRESILIDGEAARLLEYKRCYGLHHIWATAAHAGTGYHVVWIGTIGSDSEDRAEFAAILATFLFPDTPGPMPSGPTSSGPVLRPIQAGDPIPDEVLGAWYAPSAFFWVLRAGDPSCIALARTPQDCGIYDAARASPIEPATMTVESGQLVVHWWLGGCGGEISRYGFTVLEDTLTMRVASGCESGDLIFTRAGTGTAPTAPPKPN